MKLHIFIVYFSLKEMAPAWKLLINNKYVDQAFPFPKNNEIESIKKKRV